MNSTEISDSAQKIFDRLSSAAYWNNLASGYVGLLALVSDAVAYLIGDGLQGEFSAKTFIKAQAIADALQCLFLIQMGFLFTDAKLFRPVWTAIRLSDLSCKLHKWYFNFTPQLSALLTMAISLDRAVAVSFPIFYKEKGTPVNAIKFVVIPCIIISLCTSFPHFILNVLIPESEVCFLGDQYTWGQMYNNVINYIYLMVVPVIAISNAVIIRGLLKRKGQSESSKSVTWALIFLSTAFGISVVTYRVCTNMAQTQDFSDPVQYMRAELWWALGNLATVINSAVTAPIYLTMSTMRKALMTALMTTIGVGNSK